MHKSNRSFFEERTNRILQLLDQNQRVTVEEVMSLCGISSSTARLQLKELDRQGLLTRTRGGAIRRENSDPGVQTDIRNLEAKQAIAQVARTMIHEGDIIAIGGGTTTLCLAKELTDAKNLIVITNSVYVAYTLLHNRSIEVQMSGGVVRGQNGACVGPRAEELFKNISVSKSFIGADSVKENRGFTTINPDERTERRLLHSARDSFVLCDSSKFSVGPFTEVVADFSDVGYVITNCTDPAQVSMLEEKGIRVIKA